MRSTGRGSRINKLRLELTFSQLAAASLAVAPAIASLLSLPKENLIWHYGFVGVLRLHVLDVGVVVGHPHHQTRSLAEVFAETTQVIEHGAILDQASGKAWNGASLSVRTLVPQAAMPTLSAKNKILNTTNRNSAVSVALVYAL